MYMLSYNYLVFIVIVMVIEFKQIIIFRLCNQYTGNKDVLAIEDSYHGNLGVLIDVSFKMHDK